MGYLHIAIAAVTPLRPYLFYLSSAVLFFWFFLCQQNDVVHIFSHPLL